MRYASCLIGGLLTIFYPLDGTAQRLGDPVTRYEMPNDLRILGEDAAIEYARTAARTAATKESQTAAFIREAVALEGGRLAAESGERKAAEVVSAIGAAFAIQSARQEAALREVRAIGSARLATGAADRAAGEVGRSIQAAYDQEKARREAEAITQEAALREARAIASARLAASAAERAAGGVERSFQAAYDQEKARREAEAITRRNWAAEEAAKQKSLIGPDGLGPYAMPYWYFNEHTRCQEQRSPNPTQPGRYAVLQTRCPPSPAPAPAPTRSTYIATSDDEEDEEEEDAPPSRSAKPVFDDDDQPRRRSSTQMSSGGQKFRANTEGMLSAPAPAYRPSVQQNSGGGSGGQVRAVPGK